MTTAEKLVKVAENEAVIKDAVEQLDLCLKGNKVDGKSWYDEFWDIFQDYGNRGSYGSAFVNCWTDENFKPKYNIVLGGDYPADSANQMFFNCKITDLMACLKRQGVTMDLSGATRFNSTFDRCDKLISVPPINAVNCTAMNMTFYNSNKIKHIEISNIQANCTFDRAFAWLTGLESINLINSVIGQNGFDIHWSTKLTPDSLMSIINALEDKSGTGTTWTITLGTENLAKLTDTQKAIATQKGWTLA